MYAKKLEPLTPTQVSHLKKNECNGIKQDFLNKKFISVLLLTICGSFWTYIRNILAVNLTPYT